MRAKPQSGVRRRLSFGFPSATTTAIRIQRWLTTTVTSDEPDEELSVRSGIAKPVTVPPYFQWIDALRGVAAIFVVIFHYRHFYLPANNIRDLIPDNSDFPYAVLFQVAFDHGHWAVELFWVISGFVFAHVYFPRQVTLWQFSVARFARLYPLHFVTLLYMAAVQALSLASVGHWQIYGNNNLRHFALQLFMASNSVKQSRGLSFNGPIWSVSLEIAAYGLFFFSLAGLRRFPVVASMVGCGVAFALGASRIDLPVIHFKIFTCAGYFFAGTLLYGACQRLGWRPTATLLLSVILGGAALIAAAWNAQVAAACLAATAMIAALASLELVFPATGHRLKPLGDISYSVYLVHVPLQATLLLTADLIWGSSQGFADSWWLLPAYLTVSIGLALIVHRRFERPVGKYLRTRLSAKR